MFPQTHLKHAKTVKLLDCVIILYAGKYSPRFIFVFFKLEPNAVVSGQLRQAEIGCSYKRASINWGQNISRNIIFYSFNV